MPEFSSFFDSVNGDKMYSSQDFAKYFANFLSSGVYNKPSSSLQVITNHDFSVTVQSGFAFINGYRYELQGTKHLIIDVPDGVLNRIDLVVLRLDLNERRMSIEVKEGTPATNPTAPSLERTEVIYELALAQISIPKNALTIGQLNITDTRMNNELCGWVHGLIDQVDTQTIFNQYNEHFNAKSQEFEQIWADFIANARQEDNPNKQNKITYGDGFDMPIAPIDGDIHIAKIGDGITEVLRYNELTSTWLVATSNFTAYMVHQNTDRTIEGLSTVINQLKEKLNGIPLVQSGLASMPITAVNTPITHRVQFAKPFNSAPSVSLTKVTSDPRVVDASVSSVTATYFEIIVVRTNNMVTTSVQWTATERTQ